MVQESKKTESFLYLPPSTNRGVETTIGTEFRQFLLFDWIQVTIRPFKKNKVGSDVLEKYGEEEYLQRKIENYFDKTPELFNDYYDLFYYLFKVPRVNVLFNADKPLFGYEFCYSYKNIKIFGCDFRNDMGVHIYLSGTACREIEDMGISYSDLFDKLSNFNPVYTRVDVSFDDYEGKYWTMERVASCIKNVEVVTRFRSSLSIKKEDLISLDNIGYTIQFGSRASDIQFTFYDKLKERRSANCLVNENIKHWNRFEIRFRNEKAGNVVNNYLYFNSDIHKIYDIYTHIELDSFNDYIKSIINNYISFRKKSFTDKNRWRWEYQDWWREFLDNCGKIRFQSRPIEYSIVKKRAWLDHTVSYSNFCVLLADIPDLNSDVCTSKFLYELFKTGSEKITEKDIQFINEYRVSHNLLPLDYGSVKDYVREVKDFLIRR